MRNDCIQPGISFTIDEMGKIILKFMLFDKWIDWINNFDDLGI